MFTKAIALRRKDAGKPVAHPGRSDLVLDLFRQRRRLRRITSGRKLFGLPLTEAAQELLPRFKRAPDEFSFMAVVTYFVRCAVTAITIDQAGMRMGARNESVGEREK
jgi:hypothetical protein